MEEDIKAQTEEEAEQPAAEQPSEEQSAEQSQPSKPTKKQQFIQLLKFTAFSASAGIIQLLSTTLLHQWTGWLIDYY